MVAHYEIQRREERDEKGSLEDSQGEEVGEGREEGQAGLDGSSKFLSHCPAVELALLAASAVGPLSF